MASARDELDSFNRFALARLGSDEAVSLNDLFAEWHDAQSREEINQAIRRGLADADAGRHKSVEDALDAVRQRLGIQDE